MRNFWLIVVISALVSLPIFATDIYVSSLPAIEHFFNTNEYSIKLSLNIYMLGFAITTLLSGILSDAISKYKILLTGLIVFTISSFVIAHTQSLNVLIVGRGLQGLGGGTGTIIARLILKERLVASESFTQLKALSIVGANMSASPIVGPLLGAFINRMFGWDMIFYFLGLVALILFLCVLKLLLTADKTFEKQSIHPKKLAIKYNNALKNTGFLFPTIAIGLVCAAEFIFISNSAFFYQKILGFNPFAYSILLSLSLSGFLIGAYSLNYAVKKYSARAVLKRTIQICCISSLFPFLTWFIDLKLSGFVLFISTIITMAGVGVVVPLTQSIALNISETSGSAIAGLFFFTEFLIISLGGYLVSLFSCSALPMIIGILLSWVVLLNIEIFTNSDRVLENPQKID